MKNLIPALILAVVSAACAAPGVIPMDPPVVRTIERVLDRHDLYVGTDPALDTATMEAALAESSTARTLTILQEVDATLLGDVLGPVLDRHDNYVSTDPDLDALEREIYLESSERLRHLYTTVQDPVSAGAL